jgi:cyclomaltodextrin glucanotransferase
MPLWFWQEFVSDMRRHKPGVFMFGEWFLGGVHDPDSLEFTRASGMSMLDFSLRQALVSALATDGGRGFHEVAEVFGKDGLLPTASELVTFVDNHDLPRFLSIRNDAARFRLANVLVMTARGIPCIYYGSEQLLHDDTAGGGDPYNRPMMTEWDTEAPLYRDLRRLADLRRESVAVQKGGMFMHAVSGDVFVFSRRYHGAFAVVAVNRGAPVDVRVVDLPLPDGEYVCLLTRRALRVEQGRATLPLGRDDAWVLCHTPPLVHKKARCEFQLNGLSTAWGEEVFLVGDCVELAAWDYEHPIAMEYVNASTWCADVPFEATCGKDFAYKYFVRDRTSLRREVALPRRRTAPETGYRRFRDDWSSHRPD